MFSPDGQWLLIAIPPNQLEVWRIGAREPLIRVPDWCDPNCTFRADSRQVAVSHRDGSISLFDLETGGRVRRLPAVAGASPQRLALHPTEPQLAVACGSAVQVRDVDTGRVRATFPLVRDEWPFVAWHPGGRILAAVGGDEVITLWDVPTRQTVARLRHKGGGTHFAFNHAGDRLASTGWSGVLRLWDWRTGRQLLSAQAGSAQWILRFSADDRFLASGWRDGHVWLWELAAEREYRTLVRDPVLGTVRYDFPTVDRDGRLLAAGTNDGFGLWDLATGAPLAFVPGAPGSRAQFDPSGALLANQMGLWLRRWPVVAEGPVVRVGPPVPLPVPGSSYTPACNFDGRVIASAQQNQGGAVLHRDGRLVRLSQPDVRHIAVSADGRWVTTGSHDGYIAAGLKVWEADSGKPVKEFQIAGGLHSAFSPDGRWLAATGGGRCRVWDIAASWGEVFSTDAQVHHSAIAFSPDSRLLALEKGYGRIHLLDPATGQEYAVLEDPNQDRAGIPAFSPDGTQLLTHGDGESLRVWDLRALRRQLAALELDWDLPPYRPAPAADPTPLKVEVNWGDWPIIAYPRQALAVYSLAIALCPLNAEAYWLRARTYERLKDVARARADLRRFAELDQSRPGPQHAERAKQCNQVAWDLVKGLPQRDPETALSLARKAVALAPDDSMYRNTLGVAYYRLGRYAPAIAALERSLRGNNQAPAFDWFFLALCHARRGDRNEAKDCYDRAVSWVQAQGDKLNKTWAEELKAFRAEADAVLSKP